MHPMIMPMYNFKPGDIIGFSGDSWMSATINIATYGIPYWGLSHVGIVAEYNREPYPSGQTFRGVELCTTSDSLDAPEPESRLLLFESLIQSTLPCEIRGGLRRGAQAHTLKDCLNTYHGKVWHYSLHRDLRPLESRRLTAFLLKHLGKNYDAIGAVRSGGVGFSWLESRLRREDLSSLFCSEYCAGAHKHINLLDTHNASRWSPNLLARVQRRRGILLKPRRLK